MIVPSAPGDGSDVQIRIVAEQIGRQLGRTIVVENRALVDLMEGRIATISVPLGNYAQIAASGKVRALMIADERRNPQFPEAPTAGEAGLEDFGWIDRSGRPTAP
jgi:tripartite-type tricarboxylate transporter receptor subunit TctC